MQKKFDLNYNRFEKSNDVVLYVFFEDGKFYDIESGEEVVLVNNHKHSDGKMLLKIITSKFYLKNDQIPIYADTKQNTIAEEGRLLYFDLPYDLKNKYYTLTVLLQEDLVEDVFGDKPGRLNKCKCKVVEKYEQKAGVFNDLFDIEGYSLNNLFIKSSVKYRPENSTHVCNAYNDFYFVDTLIPIGAKRL